MKLKTTTQLFPNLSKVDSRIELVGSIDNVDSTVSDKDNQICSKTIFFSLLVNKSKFLSLLFILVLFIFLNVNAWGQLTCYSFSSSAGAYTALTSPTALVNSNGSNIDNYVSGAVTIPSFYFGGTSYTTAYVTSNGQLTLGGSAPSYSTNTGISTGNGSGICICPFSADLTEVYSNSNTNISYKDLTASNEFVFQWTGMRRYTATEEFCMQVILNYNSGVIKFVYKLVSGPDAITSRQPEVGIRTSSASFINVKVASGAETWSSPITSGTVNTDVCRFTSTSVAKAFTSGLTYTFTPSALSGTYTINSSSATSGTNYQTFTAAINDLNCRGVSAAVTFNVSAAQTFSENPPAITATGTSVNTITFQKSGSGANPKITPTGTAGTLDFGMNISGGDYFTFDGIDVDASASAAVEVGYYVSNSSATNGAQNNTIKNSVITLANRGSANSCYGIDQNTVTTPTSTAGANSSNKYYNLTISGVKVAGVYLNSSSTTYPDLSCEVGTTVCSTRNSISNIGATTSTSVSARGIYAYGQSGLKLWNNDISAIAGDAAATQGIYVGVGLSSSNEIYNNKISDVNIKGTTSNSLIAYGLHVELSTSGTNNVKIYNNFISNIYTNFAGTASTNICAYGIFTGISSASSSQSYDIHNNSVSIGNGLTPKYSNACFGLQNGSPVYRVKGNVFSNFTSAQTTSKHLCMVVTAAGLGGTATDFDYNDYYIATDAGTSGYIGRTAAATNYSLLADWKTFTTGTLDDNSISVAPAFTNNNTDLHASASGLDNVSGFSTQAWVTSDIDCETRSSFTPSDIGADAFSNCSSPSNQSTSFVYSNIAEQSMTLGWTRGNGNNVMIVAKAGSAPTTDPTSGSTYTANAAYTSGAACGDGYVVYSGTGTSVNLTGLTGGTTYHFAAYEFNSTGTCYNTTELTGNSATLDQETWLGVTSTAWDTGSNWSSGYVPRSTTNLTIPSGTSYAPTIAAAIVASCKNLTINSGATLTNAANTASSGYMDIYGNLINNGTINHSGTAYIYMNTNSTTIGGSGTFTDFAIQIFGSISVSITNNLTFSELSINSGSSLTLDGNTLVLDVALNQTGTLSLGTGVLEYKGTSANHTFTDSKLIEGTGTFYYNGVTNNQTIKTGTYYNLKIATISGNTATIGSSAASTVSNDLTIINPSTAGGAAILAYDINVTGNTYIGSTGNALTLTIPPSYRIIGTGTFSMGNVAGHVINIQYTSASNFAITCSGTPTFYGTVTYTSASAQKVITASSYNNLTFDLAGTKTLFGNLDVNGNLTLTAGTFDVSTFNVNLAGDFVKQTAATFTANTATFTLDGAATQYVNVTAAAGTTACDADITFYNLIIDGSDIKLYYNKTNNRKYNTNDFTVNNGKQVSFISQ